MVFQTLTISMIMPDRYIVPPIKRTQYIGLICTTVSMKSGIIFCLLAAICVVTALLETGVLEDPPKEFKLL